MNIAFPALLIIGLVLPGIVFRYTYARGSWGWTSPVSFRSMSDELAYSAIFAVGLHYAWASMATLLGYGVDYHSAVALLSGNFGDDRGTYLRAVNSLAYHPGKIAAYFLSLCGTAAVLGRASHWWVRRLKLDLRTQVFRFKNEWAYLLSGEVLSFAETGVAARTVAGVFLSAVVEHGEEAYVYRGIVQDWSFTSDGTLDNIRLALAHRRRLEDDKPKSDAAVPGSYIPPDERYYEIRGDLFILRYSEIKTLNLDYFALDEDSPPSHGTS